MQELPATGKNIVFCKEKTVIFNTLTASVVLYPLEQSIDNVTKNSFLVICFVKRKKLKECSSVNGVSTVEYVWVLSCQLCGVSYYVSFSSRVAHNLVIFTPF